MKYAAELFGTFVLVFAGLGAAVLAGSQVHNVGVAFAFGLALLAMCYTIGPISGCHINPAVTMGMLAAKRMSAKEAVGYWLAQAGGYCALHRGRRSRRLPCISCRRRQRLWYPFAGALHHDGFFYCGDVPDHAAGDHRSGRDRRPGAERIRRNTHRADSHHHHPGWNSGNERVL